MEPPGGQPRCGNLPARMASPPLLRPTDITRSFPGVVASDRVMERLEGMSSSKPTFDPFIGPLQDRNGVTRVSAGKTMTSQELNPMQWVAPGVVGPVADEPEYAWARRGTRSWWNPR